MALTEKQKLFCEHYLIDFNATAAYLLTYGGTKNTCRVEGSKQLTKPVIQAYLRNKKDKLLNKQLIFIPYY